MKIQLASVKNFEISADPWSRRVRVFNAMYATKEQRARKNTPPQRPKTTSNTLENSVKTIVLATSPLPYMLLIEFLSPGNLKNHRAFNGFQKIMGPNCHLPSFKIVLTLFMLNPQNVVWTHAGQQNRLLERPVSKAPEELRAQNGPNVQQNTEKPMILFLEHF